jgi:hypothetical protein
MFFRRYVPGKSRHYIISPAFRFSDGRLCIRTDSGYRRGFMQSPASELSQRQATLCYDPPRILDDEQAARSISFRHEGAPITSAQARVDHSGERSESVMDAVRAWSRATLNDYCSILSFGTCAIRVWSRPEVVSAPTQHMCWPLCLDSTRSPDDLSKIVR